MARCIIHIGMHKTGSSSIQGTFGDIHVSRDFVYPELGNVLNVPTDANHSVPIYILFSSRPKKHPFSKKLGWNKNKSEIKKFRKAVRAELNQCIKNSGGKTVIISGEGISMLSKGDLLKMKRYLRRRFDDILVVGYVRNPKSYMESYFQQIIKCGFRYKSFDDLCVKSYPKYRHRFEKFFDVFSAEKVRLWKFDPSVFPEGCVVRDFSARLGIEVPVERIVRKNESISREAVSLLYHYKKYGAKFGGNADVLREHRRVVRVLSSRIGGGKVRLSHELVAPILEQNRADIEWMEEKLGESLTEEISYVQDGCITCEEDLLKLDGKAMAQLVDLLYERTQRKEPGEEMLDAGKTGGEGQAAVIDAGHAGKPETEKEKTVLKRNELTEKLIGRISQKSYGPEVKKSAKAVMDEFIMLLVDELKTSGEVRIPELGAFKIVEKPGDADTPARKVIKFSIGKNLKEYFQG